MEQIKPKVIGCHIIEKSNGKYWNAFGKGFAESKEFANLFTIDEINKEHSEDVSYIHLSDGVKFRPVYKKESDHV